MGYLRNGHGHYLAVSGNANVPGTSVIVWTKEGEQGQQWELTAGGKLKSALQAARADQPGGRGPLFLAMAGNSKEKGLSPIVWTAENEAGQLWTLEPSGHLRNGHGRCLAMPKNKKRILEKRV